MNFVSNIVPEGGSQSSLLTSPPDQTSFSSPLKRSIRVIFLFRISLNKQQKNVTHHIDKDKMSDLKKVQNNESATPKMVPVS